MTEERATLTVEGEYAVGIVETTACLNDEITVCFTSETESLQEFRASQYLLEFPYTCS